jgi:uncharacterized protein (TIGR03000 family)
MQGKWLKLSLLAGLAVLLVVADGNAQIFRRGRYVRTDTVMAEQIPAPSVAADGTQPAQPTTVSQSNNVIMEPVYATRRDMRRGRVSYYQPVVLSQQPPAQPVAQGQPAQPIQPAQPATVQQQPTTNQPVVTTGTYYQEPVYRGRRGRRFVYSDNIYQPVSGTTTTSRPAFYGPQAGVQQGWLDIRVPASTAQVLINDVPTNVQGMNRLFITPALDPQRENLYEIKAKWTQNGQQVEKSKEIKIQPGQRVVIDFNAQNGNTPTP